MQGLLPGAEAGRGHTQARSGLACFPRASLPGKRCSSRGENWRELCVLMSGTCFQGTLCSFVPTESGLVASCASMVLAQRLL